MRWKSALLVIRMRFFLGCPRATVVVARHRRCMHCGKQVDEWWESGGYAVEKCLVSDKNAFLHNVDNLWTSRV